MQEKHKMVYWEEKKGGVSITPIQKVVIITALLIINHV